MDAPFIETLTPSPSPVITGEGKRRGDGTSSNNQTKYFREDGSLGSSRELLKHFESRAATDRGDEEFIVGANFTPTDNWWYCWNGWHGESIAENMRVCKEHGLNDLRVFLLWPYFQPDPGVIAAEPLARLEELACLAEQCEVRLYVTLINGWLSGPLFDVP